MFQLFLRARARNLKTAIAGSDFKARSSERDAATDRSRIASIMSVVENALSSAEGEQLGLRSRMDDVLARASISVGNDTDEYLDREPHRTATLNFFDQEMASGRKQAQRARHDDCAFQIRENCDAYQISGIKVLDNRSVAYQDRILTQKTIQPAEQEAGTSQSA